MRCSYVHTYVRRYTVQCILGYLNLVYPNHRLSKLLQLATVNAQLINFKMAAIIIIHWCVHNIMPWYGLFTVEQKRDNADYQINISCYSLQWRHIECQESYEFSSIIRLSEQNRLTEHMHGPKVLHRDVWINCTGCDLYLTGSKVDPLSAGSSPTNFWRVSPSDTSSTVTTRKTTKKALCTHGCICMDTHIHRGGKYKFVAKFAINSREL